MRDDRDKRADRAGPGRRRRALASTQGEAGRRSYRRNGSERARQEVSSRPDSENRTIYESAHDHGVERAAAPPSQFGYVSLRRTHMRRLPINVLITILAVVFVVTGWQLYARQETERFRAVHAVRQSETYFRMTMRVESPSGPIATEQYTLLNDNGKSRATYAVGDRKGTIATFDEVIRGYDVTFAFDKLVQDGIWELDTKRPRAPRERRYWVTIEQTAQTQSGRRSFSFTDPKYWAVAAGRQYHIVLDPKAKTPTASDLLHLESTSVAETRYAKIVADFEAFGSPAFHRTVASARAKLLRS